MKGIFDWVRENEGTFHDFLNQITLRESLMNILGYFVFI